MVKGINVRVWGVVCGVWGVGFRVWEFEWFRI